MKTRIKSATHCFGVLCLITAALLISGCAGKKLSIGYERRIPLKQNESINGTHNQEGHTIHYTYYLSGSDLKLEGRVSGRSNVLTMEVKALMLDENGHILAQHPLYYSGYRTYEDIVKKSKFNRTFKIPENTSDLSFDIAAEYRIKTD